jgi:D-glycero-alpha-D-manno-heptose-7-phosphate kinase
MVKTIRRAIAPVRINFAGGGTDIKPYIDDYGSYILSAAIKLYSRACYFDEYQPKHDIERILTKMVGRGGVMITTDCHASSGLGTSASSLVAGIKVIYDALQGEQIAQQAFYLEREIMQVGGGKQDQYCATFGGLQFIIFEGDKVEMQKMEMPEEFSRAMVLVYSGERENSGDDVIKDQVLRYNVKALHHQKQSAKAMRDCVVNNDLVGFAEILNEVWKSKKEMSPLVATEKLNSLYDKCISLGALAGCVMGAGGGGYMLLVDNPNDDQNLRQNLLESGIHYHNIEVDEKGVRVMP